MVSKLKSLFLFAFVVHWSTGYAFFLSNRRDSSSSTGSDNSPVQTPNNVDAVTHWHRPPTPIPIQAEALLAVNEYIPPPGATIPLPIAIQLPQQILPLAMYPTIQASYQNFKSSHRAGAHHNNHNNAIPFVKVSPAEYPGPLHASPAAGPSTITAVRFVPCFCGNNNEEKRGYARAGIPYAATPMGYQPLQLLPCYCPIMRELAEPQYVQSIPVPSSTVEPTVRDYSVSTISPK